MCADRPGVVVVGDITTDIVVRSPVPLARAAVGTDTRAGIRLAGGGSAANTAAWLAAAGTPVTLVGAVGTDADGDARLAELAAAGVGCRVERVPAPTGAVLVVSDPYDRTMLSDRGADLLLANLDEARVLAGAPTVGPADAAGALTALAGTVVVKHGADGAVLAGRDGVIAAPAVPVAVVDHTGAGDAFAAGLLRAWLSGAAPAAALRAGTELGARAVSTAGGRPPAVRISAPGR